MSLRRTLPCSTKGVRQRTASYAANQQETQLFMPYITKSAKMKPDPAAKQLFTSSLFSEFSKCRLSIGNISVITAPIRSPPEKYCNCDCSLSEGFPRFIANEPNAISPNDHMQSHQLPSRQMTFHQMANTTLAKILTPDQLKPGIFRGEFATL